MRLDHIAYRVADRHKTVEFFKKAFGYTVQTEFEIKFPDGSTAKCFALEPPEKLGNGLPWSLTGPEYEVVNPKYEATQIGKNATCRAIAKPEYHLAPELFVSDGTPDSIVGKWVAARGGVGGIHHMAYQVESVEQTMKEWKEKGYAEFTSESPMRCPNLVQVFSRPSLFTGIIYEFIERGAEGFCRENVKQLMESTDGLS